MKAKRIVGVVAKIALGLLVAAHAFLLYFCIANTVTTIIVYGLLYVILASVIRKYLVASTPEKRQNVLLLCTAVIASLLLSELLLKYVYRQDLNYKERNGGVLYISSYQRYKFENIARQFIKKETNLQLYRHQPGTVLQRNKTEYAYAANINSLGFRGKEPQPCDSCVTVLALGDSFTEGVGSPDDSTWVTLLEEMYAGDSVRNNVRLINAGVSGSDLFYEYKILEHLFHAFQPQAVILSVNASDIDDYIVRGGFERFNNPQTVVYRKGPWWEYIYSFSFIFRRIVHGVWGLNRNFLTEQQETILREEAKGAICNAITKAYSSFTAAKNLKLIVVFQPMLEELNKNKFELSHCMKTLQANEVYVIDLFPAFKSEIEKLNGNTTILFWQNDLHYTPTGNVLVASEIFSGCKKSIDALRAN
ncbi:MAG: hypothetical protein KIS94_01315 [Chitinophagales bacterium]|nr:hypothetical protein [Chitinophagales bacterium]